MVALGLRQQTCLPSDGHVLYTRSDPSTICFCTIFEAGLSDWFFNVFDKVPEKIDSAGANPGPGKDKRVAYRLARHPFLRGCYSGFLSPLIFAFSLALTAGGLAVLDFAFTGPAAFGIQ
jgi:hypothetical protein